MGSQLGALFGGFFGDAGQNFVDLQGGKKKVFGVKPKVADFTPTNLSDEIGKTTQANLDNASNINELLNRMIPGFSDLVKQGLSTSGALMSGELPPEVMETIMRHSAEMGIAHGDAYSQSGDFRSLRNLGIGTLEGMQMGANSMQQWTKLAETSYDPFIIKTMQQAGTTAANNAGIQANEQMKFNVAAAPDPGAAGVFALDAALGQQMLSMGGAMGGAAMAGGGGGGGGYSYTGAGAAGVAKGNNWQIATPNNGGEAMQYDPATGTYRSIPRATSVWGGG